MKFQYQNNCPQLDYVVFDCEITVKETDFPSVYSIHKF